MKSILLALTLAVLVPCASRAAELSAPQKADLDAYGKVRGALVAMDLARAKAAATASASVVLPGNQAAVGELAASPDMKEARKAFRKWSDALIPVAKGQPGYFIAHCPMVKANWVQTDEKITNPFAGDSMPACGVIVKP